MITGENVRGNRASVGAWLLLTSVATVIGVYSLRYGLPKVPNVFLPNFVTRPHFLIAHALAASVALLLGPWQFVDRLRRKWPEVHRFMGRTYVASVVIAWVSSIPVALHAYTGAVASAGFLGLGIFWIATTTNAVKFILRGNVTEHKRWMIRSYALTTAAITLRIYLGLALGFHLPKSVAYEAISWLCWVPNIIVVEAFFEFRLFVGHRRINGRMSSRSSRSKSRWRRTYEETHK